MTQRQLAQKTGKSPATISRTVKKVLGEKKCLTCREAKRIQRILMGEKKPVKRPKGPGETVKKCGIKMPKYMADYNEGPWSTEGIQRQVINHGRMSY